MGPAHAVAALAIRGIVHMRQAERGFLHADQMRSEDHAAGVAGPVGHVESRIIFREMRVAAVAEDPFDEIEIAHQAAGSEEARLHGSRRVASGGRTHKRAKHQGNEKMRRLVLARGEGQLEYVARRAKRGGEQGGKGLLGNRLLVGGNREAAFGNMEDAARGAAVTRWIVQNALRNPVGAHVRGRKAIGVRRQRHRASQTGAIENKGTRGQVRRAARTAIRQVGIEKRLNAGVGGTQMLSEQPFLFIMIAQERPGNLQETSVSGILCGRLAEGSELEMKVLN